MKFSAAGPIREACVILGLTVVGAVPRLAGTEGLGLSHFDEGVYAMAGFWVTTSRGLASIPPRVIPFAPPGLPILVGMAYLMLGFTDKAAIAVAQATGILTVPVLGWLGRRTFGPGAGAASAAVAAVAGSHVAFSRMALTDVPFLLIWLIAIGLGARFLERPRAGSAVTLGLAIGVAQNFKYNGWLLAVVVAVAAAIGFVRRRGPKREILKTVGFGLLATVVAFLIDLPWVRFVEANGGYRKLLAHHRSYVQGFGAWPRNWASQMRQSSPSRAVPSGGPVPCSWPRSRSAWSGAG